MTTSCNSVIENLVDEFAERLAFRGQNCGDAASLKKSYMRLMEEWGAKRYLGFLYDELFLVYKQSYNGSEKLAKKAIAKLRRKLDSLPDNV